MFERPIDGGYVLAEIRWRNRWYWLTQKQIKLSRKCTDEREAWAWLRSRLDINVIENPRIRIKIVKVP